MSWISNVWQPILVPLLAPLGAILVGLGSFVVGVGTMRVARQQARIAEQSAGIADRQAQTAAQQAATAANQAQIAERQAVTTGFHNAVSRLASDKIEERLGGIYMLERISRDSPADYRTVMETLCAFVRERARWKEPEEASSETVARFYGKAETTESQISPPTDIAAVLAVIRRRPEKERDREKREYWSLDLHGADLRRSFLLGAHLEGAVLAAHFEGAFFTRAHLEGAWLGRAHLEGAYLRGAHLEGAWLGRAHLEGASLMGAHLEGANLEEAHLEGVDLSEAFGDAKTRLPDGVPRPAHWPAYQP
jgi:hypothetical protein